MNDLNNQLKFDHYVYRLVDKEGDTVYVGEGRGNRCNYKQRRKESLESIWDFCRLEILAKDLSKKQSLEIEAEFILDELIKGNNKLLNCIHNKEYLNYEYDLLSSVLVISADSPTGIAWKKNNKPAGLKTNNGYAKVCVNYKSYLINRVVWVLHHKKSLNYEDIIHHIDGNPLNNSPENLLKVSITENNIMRKTRKPKDFCYYSKLTKKGNRYRSVIRLLNGKTKEITVKIDDTDPEGSAKICSLRRNEIVMQEYINYPHLLPYLLSAKIGL